jgi:hypothetical protein
MAEYRNTNLLKPFQFVRENPAINRTVDWLLPQIAEKSRVANDMVPEQFWQYTIQRYRICSCFKGEASPDALCNACFGTGYLPGYTPLGYRTFVVLDITTPGLILNNIIPDFNSGSHPTPLRLSDTALSGYLETPFLPIEPNLGFFNSVYFAGSNFGLDLSYTLDGMTWFPLNETPNPLLKIPRDGMIKFRAYLSRVTLNDPLPYLQVVICRVQVAENPLIKMDVPRFVSALDSSDAGIVPILNTFNAFANYKQVIEIDTIFVHERSYRKFKTLNSNINAPVGKVLSWDIQLRLLQNDEALSRII